MSRMFSDVVPLTEETQFEGVDCYRALYGRQSIALLELYLCTYYMYECQDMVYITSHGSVSMRQHTLPVCVCLHYLCSVYIHMYVCTCQLPIMQSCGCPVGRVRSPTGDWFHC